MDSSGPSSSNAVNEAGGSQQYNPHPSQVPISNFVSIKLSGETNYVLWEKQMMCLLEYHDMVGFIDGTIRNPMDYFCDDDDDYHDAVGDAVDDDTGKSKEWNNSKDTLVKGWIFGTLSEDVFSTVLDLHNAYRVWKELKNSYDNSHRVEGAELLKKKQLSFLAKEEVGDSQQYNPHPSQVPISNFVSIKLSGETNYVLWKKQMMCLLEYHDMVGFIDGTIRNSMDYYDNDNGYDAIDDGDGNDDDDVNKVEMTTGKSKEWNKSKDTLVKGWIFGTLSEDVFSTVLDLHNAYRVWKELKNSYDNSHRVEGAELLKKKQLSFLEEEEAGGSQQYNPHPSQVPISNFVSIKLSGKIDYVLWKKQMMCLLEYHDMVGFIDGTIRNPMDDDGNDHDDDCDDDHDKVEMTTGKSKEWNKSKDTLVKGWIFGTLSEDVFATVLHLHNAYRVWKELKNSYDNSDRVEGAELLKKKQISFLAKEEAGGSQQYNPHPSQVPISNFVSIKLSGETNYVLWKKQMMCLLEYHDMVGFIDGTIRNPMDYDDADDDDDYHDAVGDAVDDDTGKSKEWNKSKDTLVKGWIIGTLSEDVFSTVLNLHNAYRVWKELKNSYDNSHRVEGAELLKKKQLSFLAKEEVADEAKYIPLCRAIERGDWDKAREIFNEETDTLTARINWEGDTPLHLAVYTRQKPQFVKNLLEKIEAMSLPTLVSSIMGYTTLHHAALVGYIEAAEMLVKKNPQLLFIADDEGYLPILRALLNDQEKTFLYLLDASKLHIDLFQIDGYQNPFEGRQGCLLLGGAISRGYMKIAYELICEYPKLAISEDETLSQTPLWYIVKNQDLYFSATQYNSYQRFIYSHIPIKKRFSKNDNRIPDIENPENCSTKFITKCKKSCFYPVIKWIYVKVWEATLLHVPHIKRLQKDKLKHKETLMILKRICEEIRNIKEHSKIYNQYCGAFNMAVLKDNHEAVEMIIRFFPKAIWTSNNHNYLLQTVAKDRCEMVLNYLKEHAFGGINLLLSTPPDKNENNVLHLAGLLAPIEKLNAISGAALQMQKEVQWFKRVEKCMLKEEGNKKGAKLHKIEKFMLISKTEERNKKGQTPIMVFREKHKNLRKEGEEWMKKTSDAYTITAALIITIVFAAAITVPGGNDQTTGKPIYKTDAGFIIFAISDAISLFTSTTSLLLFLSILTARYHEDDFLYKLPKRLIFGLVMLFMSVTSMMVAFGATLYIMFGQGKEWILIPIAALACLPIASYVILQYPLLSELVSSTYGLTIYKKKNNLKNK